MNSIFHLRFPAFEIQSERLLDSSLSSRAVAVISSHHSSGTVVALSDEAREEGLYPGIKFDTARKMSGATRFLPYNTTLYDKVNRYVYQRLNRYSPLAEPEDFGRYYLDMSGMDRHYRGLKNAASMLCSDLKDSMDLSGLVGISSNKLVSSISTEVAEERIQEVPEGMESPFLDPLQAQLLPSAREKKLQRILSFLMISTIRDIRLLTEDQPAAGIFFGQNYRQLYQESRGQDRRLVMPLRQKEQILHQLVLNNDSNDIDMLHAAVRRLAEQTAYELRRRAQVASEFIIEIHYSDGFRKLRKGKLSDNSDAHVVEEARQLFDKANERRNRIRSILCCTRDFKAPDRQIDLFAAEKYLEQDISATLDRLRDKYGFESVMSAAAMFRTEPRAQARLSPAS